MNSNIERLFKIGLKPARLIIGLMSGTSVDGLDVALCECHGSGNETEISLLQFETITYNDDYRNEIKSIFSKREVDLEKVCLLNGWIAQQHAIIVLDCLKNGERIPDRLISSPVTDKQFIMHPNFCTARINFPTQLYRLATATTWL